MKQKTREQGAAFPLRRLRFAALLFSLLVVMTLFAGFAVPKTTYLIGDGDLLYTVQSFTGGLSEALERAGIALSPLDRVVSDTDEEKGLTRVTIVRTVLTSEARHESIPYRTIRRANPELPLGTEVLAQQGVDGIRAYDSEATITDGQAPVSRFYGVSTLAEPVDEIWEYGTGLPAVEQSWLSVSGDVLVALDEEAGLITTASGQTFSYSRSLAVTATAYTTERQAWKITATGTTARVGAIAVDPKVIPYGTRMFILSADGAITYGVATAEDCGGSIKGNKIDLFFDTYYECIQFGRRACTVYILDGADA